MSRQQKKLLREEFQNYIDLLFDQWNEEGLTGSPFDNEGETQTLLDNSGYQGDDMVKFFGHMGWIRGVSDATGWPIAPSRVRDVEWDPRNR